MANLALGQTARPSRQTKIVGLSPRPLGSFSVQSVGDLVADRNVTKRCKPKRCLDGGGRRSSARQIKEINTMFVEGLGSASVVNGVLRVETYARNARGEDVPNGELLVPVTRVIALSEALQGLIAQIRAQVSAEPVEPSTASAE
jgi:hypothetical protein